MSITYLFLKLCLALHVAGLTMAAGTSLTDYVVYRQFWKSYAGDQQKFSISKSSILKFQWLKGIGIGILIISGITMMLLTHGIFMEQIWFKIKLGVIILILINEFVIKRKLILRLVKRLSVEAGISSMQSSVFSIKKPLSVSIISQLLLFLLVFLLAAFRFN